MSFSVLAKTMNIDPVILEKAELIRLAMSRSGQFASIVTERPCKMRKKFEKAGVMPITKKLTTKVRFGVDYENTKVVKDARENGTLAEESSGLPWGEWVVFPYLIKHTKNDVTNYYVRCTTVPNSKSNVTYIQDGLEISKDVVEPLCLASEFPKTPKADTDIVFNVKLDNLVSVR